MSDFIIFAHRGASGWEPENTLRSFRRALELGTRWVELDAHCAEGEVIVIHDDSLERTTTGKGKLDENSLEYIRSVDAGKGEKIPFLREVFTLIGKKAGINIELKGKKTAAPVSLLLEECGDIIDRERILVSSFRFEELENFRSLAPDIKIGLLYDKVPPDFSAAEALQAYSLNVEHSRVTKAWITEAHRRGFRVYLYTVNSRRRAEVLQDLGAEGIFSDYPEILSKSMSMQIIRLASLNYLLNMLRRHKTEG